MCDDIFLVNPGESRLQWKTQLAEVISWSISKPIPWRIHGAGRKVLTLNGVLYIDGIHVGIHGTPYIAPAGSYGNEVILGYQNFEGTDYNASKHAG